MAVPYTFGSATSSIPLSQLDSNFATTITLGNTAIQLGNTVTTLNNMTLANVTVQTGNVTIGQANAVVYTNSSNVATANASVLSLVGGALGVGNATPTTYGNSNTRLVLYRATSGNTYVNQIIGTDNVKVATYVNDATADTIGKIGTATNHDFAVLTNGTERARFNTTGAFVLAGGTTTADGIGITFPASQSASTNANTLDDYEEGTWTPTLTSAGGSASVSAGVGRYTKIGNQVFATVGFAFSASSATGQITLGGLPFASNSTTGYRAAAAFGYVNGVTFSGQLATDLVNGFTSTPIISLVSSSNPTNIVLLSSGNFQVSIVYQV